MSVHQISDARAKKIDSDGLFLNAQYDSISYHERQLEGLANLNALNERLIKLTERLLEEG